MVEPSGKTLNESWKPPVATVGPSNAGQYLRGDLDPDQSLFPHRGAQTRPTPSNATNLGHVGEEGG